MTTQQQLIDAITGDVWNECCWAESLEECNEIIEKGMQKINAITGVKITDFASAVLNRGSSLRSE